jgi:hypothetical protein
MMLSLISGPWLHEQTSQLHYNTRIFFKLQPIEATGTPVI